MGAGLPAAELPAIGAGLPATVDGGVTTGVERMPAVAVELLPLAPAPPTAAVEPATVLAPEVPAKPLGFDDCCGSVSAEQAATQPINTNRNAHTDLRASLMTYPLETARSDSRASRANLA